MFNYYIYKKLQKEKEEVEYEKINREKESEFRKSKVLKKYFRKK
jgi:hypothetical protein